jgi:peptidyl-prolyl cis-trans isomerase B (cyclophilin B)
VRLVAVLLTVLLAAGCLSRSRDAADGREPGEDPAGESSEPAADVDSCEFVVDPDEDAPVGLPPNEPASASAVALRTSAGDLTITLTEDMPCAVRNFTHLAREGFYDGIACHRLTTSATLKVLQCGDPKGDGTGGPGYTIPTEPVNLPPDPSSPDLVVYPRGAVAMATTSEPNSAGSQFFMLYADASLPPAYPVFGRLDQNGLATLDAVAARGITPGNGPEDGAPTQRVEIESATVR